MTPNLYDLDLSLTESLEKLKEYMEYISNSYGMDNGRKKALQSMINFYNGTAYDAAKVRSMINIVTKDTNFKFSRYNLGRSKLRVLPNEFLGTPLQFSIFTLDRQSNINRLDRFRTSQALAIVKPAIEEVQKEGYDVFSGMQLPDEEQVEQDGLAGIRLETEVCMQAYIEEKKLDKDLKRQLLKQVVYAMCANECFGKVEPDYDGKLKLRSISPIRCIRVDNEDNDWSETTPYIGEYRSMDLTTIKRLYNLTKKELDDIKELNDSNGIAWAGSGDKGRAQGLIDTYTIQFRNNGEKLYFKTKQVDGRPVVFDISKDYYDKNKKRIDREVAAGKYQIDTRILEKIYECTYIASGINILTNVHISNVATMLNGKGHIYPTYDYVHLKLNYVSDEIAEPIASIVKQLDEDYDMIRYLINRELKKPQGNYMTYDIAFLPKTAKSYEELRRNIVESGEIQYDTSADGNASQTQGTNSTGINSVKLGDINVIMEMMNVAMNLEQTAERITGINESRNGLTKASSTATTSNNNLEASRTMTYDIFWNIQAYGERVITVMCNKLKSNPAEVNPRYSYSLMDEDQYDRFMETSDMILSDFRAYVNDGRKDAAIISYLQQAIFPQDIAAGKLTSLNSAEFLSKNSLPEALDVLRKAENLFNKMAQQNQQAAVDAETAKQQAKDQSALGLEQLRGENNINSIAAERDAKIAINEHVESKRDATKQMLESQKRAAAESVANINGHHRHADVDKTNVNKLKETIIAGEQNRELKKLEPKPTNSTTKK